MKRFLQESRTGEIRPVALYERSIEAIHAWINYSWE